MLLIAQLTNHSIFCKYCKIKPNPEEYTNQNASNLQICLQSVYLCWF